MTIILKTKVLLGKFHTWQQLSPDLQGSELSLHSVNFQSSSSVSTTLLYLHAIFLLKKAGLIKEEMWLNTMEPKEKHDTWITEEITKNERKIKKKEASNSLIWVHMHITSRGLSVAQQVKS